MSDELKNLTKRVEFLEQAARTAEKNIRWQGDEIVEGFELIVRTFCNEKILQEHLNFIRQHLDEKAPFRGHRVIDRMIHRLEK